MIKEVLLTLRDVKEFFVTFNREEYSMDTETSHGDESQKMWNDRDYHPEESTRPLMYAHQVITAIQMCDGKTCCHIALHEYNREEIIEWLSLEVFDTPNKGKDKKVVCQNIPFDASVLHKYNINFDRAKWFDTMVASHLVDENTPNGLKWMVENILDKPVEKFNPRINHYTQEFYNYGLDDAENTWLLYQHFLPSMLSDQQTARLFFKIEMPFQRVLTEMRVQGVDVDIKLLGEQRHTLVKDKVLLLKQLHDAIGVSYTVQKALFQDTEEVISNVNFNSSQQIASILFDQFELEPIEETPTGQRKVGKVTKEKYKEHPFVALLIQYSGCEKLLSSFVEPLPKHLDKDGKVRPNFRDTGTKTGRLSCIAKGTKIQTVRDFSKEPEGRNIEDIKEGDLVYASDGYGGLVTRKVKKIINNGLQECVKLKWKSLSNKFDGELLCTPDHRIKTLDGKWTKAEDITLTSDSEIGYKRRMGEDISLHKRGYSLHFQLNDYAYIYYAGMKKVKNIRYLTGATKGYSVHHKDQNKLNDTLDNLQLMTPKEHTKLHTKLGGGFNEDSQVKAQGTLRDMRLRGDIKYNKPLKHFSFAYCMYLADKHKGMIKYIIQEEHHDFETIHREMNRHGIDLKEVKKVYEETNHYFVGRENAGIQQVYDLEIESDDMYDTHNFFANEICVHNCSHPNLQQLADPKKADYKKINFREVFIAPQGYKMFSADYSGQEVAIMAQVSKDPTLVEALNGGMDMHLTIANQFYELGIPKECLNSTHPDYDKWKSKFKVERGRAKTITFGLAYGKGAYGFAKDFGISEDEAQKIVDDYFDGMPLLKKSIDDTHKEVKEYGYVRNLVGRYRRFTPNDEGYYPNMALRQSFNFKIQGFAADMIRTAAVNIWIRKHEFPQWDLKFIMTVHDELNFIVKEEFADEAGLFVKDIMESCVNFVVPTKSDIEVGTNYGNSK